MVSNHLLEPKNRLIVLIPDGVTANLELARKIHWIALRDPREVLYLALVDHADDEYSVSRSITTMKAITATNLLPVKSKLTRTADWLTTLRAIYQPGDQIVCHEEQCVRDGFLRTKPVAEFLRDTLHAHITTVSGFYHPARLQTRQWLNSFVSWFGFLTILGLFGLLEFQIDQSLQGTIEKILFILILLIEFGTIWAWNRITTH